MQTPAQVLVDINQRFDQIAGLVAHQHQRGLYTVQAVERVGDQLFRMDPVRRDQTGKPFCAKPSAAHQASVDPLMSHAAAPFDAGNPHIIALAQIVDISDGSARLEHADCLIHGIHVSASDDDLVHGAMVHVQNLLNDVSVAVIDNLRGAIFQRQRSAVFPRANCVQLGGSANGGGGDSHQANRTNAD